MTFKTSFIITVQFIVVLFSLRFIKDAFFYWDGYSHYMEFRDFLPDLALVFVIWTVLAASLAVLLWLLIYCTAKLLSTFFHLVLIEHITIYFLTISSIFLIKRSLWGHTNLHNLIGMPYILALCTGGLIIAIMLGLIYKSSTQILEKVNVHIKPLIWIFMIMFIIALPLSQMERKTSSYDGSKPTVSKSEKTKKREKSPNIIMITMDTLTALDMELYGYDRPTTPFISGWAKNATVFNRAYSTTNWTTPSVMSLMTGQRPWTHRVWYYAINYPVRNYRNNMPKVLKDNGYSVYAFVQNGYAHPDILGIKDSFLTRDKAYKFWNPGTQWWFSRIQDHFSDRPFAVPWLFYENNIIGRQIQSMRPDTTGNLWPSEKIYNSFLKFIAEKSEEPFFAWLHPYPPHAPYLPPDPYSGVFGDGDTFATQKSQARLTNTEYAPHHQKDVDILRKRYDEFILYSDKQFELFISRLAKAVDMSNTVIILSSDHGESFSHGYQAHNGPHLYEPFIRVPLIIRLPGNANSKTIKVPVELTDIPPTILEIAGISTPDWMEGQSLFPLIKGSPFTARPVFAMQLIKNRAIGNHPITKGTVAVVDGDYKLIHYLEEEKTLMFDLTSDPGESSNLSLEQPDRKENLLKLIKSLLVEKNKSSVMLKK